MWRVYKHTGKDKDYEIYKEATHEIRKYKRNVEHKLAQHIGLKSDSTSFCAYVRSKQNVQDKVGPLEDNAENIITQGFFMAEKSNMHFIQCSREKSTLPESKFNEPEGEMLGQLDVDPNPRSSS